LSLKKEKKLKKAEAEAPTVFTEENQLEVVAKQNKRNSS